MPQTLDHTATETVGETLAVYVGVDLGSTTTKAVLLDAAGEVVGRGITNSRSNYDVAVALARAEAFVEARFNLLYARLRSALGDTIDVELETPLERSIMREFRLQQHLRQLGDLESELFTAIESERYAQHRDVLRSGLADIISRMREGAPKHFRFSQPSTEFFRDLAASEFMALAQEKATRSDDFGDSARLDFDQLAGIFDKAILIVENKGLDLSFQANIKPAFERVIDRYVDELGALADDLRDRLPTLTHSEIEVAGNVGTGYGRARLPFAKDEIRSEILCHGLGAHVMFPKTATVLDIGGQDTKAIQVDGDGIVTSFQMNDRCAAGCGRYLGYIADEMNLGIHELGPLAEQASHRVKINSTCTVFAGAELRDRLTMGQKREDILGGLHRAIILRAMSLLARSGGIEDQFTFTGGVANNTAAVAALRELIEENYGEMTINISPNSIYTGALGAALFALRGASGQAAPDPKLPKRGKRRQKAN